MGTEEQRILVVMRKVLGQVVRETTPRPGLKHPLSEATVEDIRQCFALIAARERKLANAAGVELRERPHYVDEPRTAEVIPMSRIGRQSRNNDDE